ncbi:hypothetical protein AS593_07550 [Caulobacter vibrioides]|nr:hypothetical protein AS593_07550 [Caulobacter vibrioides]
MTGDARAWLPPGFILRDEVRAALGGAVAAWADRWFEQHGFSASSLSAERPATPSDPTTWRRPAGTIAIDCPARARARLTGRALDMRLESQALRDGDQALVDALGERILKDLALELEAAFGVRQPASSPRSGALLYATIGDGQNGPVASIAAPEELVLAFCRSRLPPPSVGADKPLRPIDACVGAETVTLSAALGSVEISLAEFQGLAPGDVLVLDTGADTLLPLRRADGTDSGLRGRLTQLDNQVALTLDA